MELVHEEIPPVLEKVRLQHHSLRQGLSAVIGH
jgi:hypothetical protein